MLEPLALYDSALAGVWGHAAPNGSEGFPAANVDCPPAKSLIRVPVDAMLVYCWVGPVRENCKAPLTCKMKMKEKRATSALERDRCDVTDKAILLNHAGVGCDVKLFLDHCSR